MVEVSIHGLMGKSMNIIHKLLNYPLTSLIFGMVTMAHHSVPAGGLDRWPSLLPWASLRSTPGSPLPWTTPRTWHLSPGRTFGTEGLWGAWEGLCSATSWRVSVEHGWISKNHGLITFCWPKMSKDFQSGPWFNSEMVAKSGYWTPGGIVGKSCEGNVSTEKQWRKVWADPCGMLLVSPCWRWGKSAPNNMHIPLGKKRGKKHRELSLNGGSQNGRRKFRSQTSDNMDRWKSRGGKSQRHVSTGLHDLLSHVSTGLNDLFLRHMPTGPHDPLRHMPTGINDLLRHMPTGLRT